MSEEKHTYRRDPKTAALIQTSRDKYELFLKQQKKQRNQENRITKLEQEMKEIRKFLGMDKT